jgi:hypothetical protein
MDLTAIVLRGTCMHVRRLSKTVRNELEGAEEVSESELVVMWSRKKNEGRQVTWPSWSGWREALNVTRV